MRTRAEIEVAINALPIPDKRELLLSLAAQLGNQNGTLPLPRRFSLDEIKKWIAKDEAAMLTMRDRGMD